MMPFYGKLGTNWNNKNGRIAVIQEMNESKILIYGNKNTLLGRTATVVAKYNLGKQ